MIQRFFHPVGQGAFYSERQRDIFFNDIGFEDIVTEEHRGIVTWF